MKIKNSTETEKKLQQLAGHFEIPVELLAQIFVERVTDRIYKTVFERRAIQQVGGKQ